MKKQQEETIEAGEEKDKTGQEEAPKTEAPVARTEETKV